MSSIYIIGHKKPDTDSICSALGYADFLNMNNPCIYVAARCGEINPETSFALTTFRRSPPEYIESVAPSVSDMPFKYTVSAPADTPTIDVADQMVQHDIRNMPLTDEKGHFLGIMSEHGLARTYVTRHKIEPLTFAPIKLDTLERILEAKIIVPSGDLLEGKVYIAIDALHVTLSRLTKHDIAIVGDNEPPQLALISAGIAALIIADGAPVGERVIQSAKERGVLLLATGLDAFGVGKMINLSLPAREMMATDVPTVTMDTSIEYAKRAVTDSRYRTACIVGENNTYLGMLSRNTFLEEVQKQVILVDHNEYTQAVDGIETAEIIEIIDHHRIGAMTTLKPIKFLNDPLGSTSTIIAQKFMDSGKEPEWSTAGLLLSGILSDTMVLRLSTTTPADHEAVAYLAGIVDMDPLTYGTDLIEKGMDMTRASISDQLLADMKAYELFGRHVIISQVMVPTFDFCHQNNDEIRREVDKIHHASLPDLYLAMYTSVFENASMVYAQAKDQLLLEELGFASIPVTMEGVMSRKNDFIPKIGSLLKNI
ncbi:MAG TPA: putative manganese-dependent inorganic diphosphatase [Methanoculleus sp.]|nr:putative manganese-dependent inorganic diphosphatase [Methanoculleus sp.]